MTKLVLLAPLAVACTSAPARPSWQADVAPIMAANCVRCHGYPAMFGAPPTFRLDVLGDAPDPATGLTLHGAGTMYYRIKERVDDESMPPKFPLIGDSIDVIDHWAGEATPSDIVHDVPTAAPDAVDERPGNHAPTIAMQPTGAPDEYAYEIDDRDGDLVDGQLRIDDAVIARYLHAGRGTVHVDLSQVPDGTHAVSATLDDGVGHAGVTVPDLTIEASGRGATPIDVSVVFPRALDLVTRNDARAVQLCANQAGVTANVSAVDPRGVRARVTLATGAAIAHCATASSTPTDVPWQAFKDQLADPVSDWVIEIEATAGAYTATSRSPRFRISHADPGPSFSTVKLLVGSQCGLCHKSCGAYPQTLPYDFNDYAGTKQCGSNLGAGDDHVRGLMYEHVVVRRDMPPGAYGPLADGDRTLIEQWLVGGSQP